MIYIFYFVCTTTLKINLSELQKTFKTRAINVQLNDKTLNSTRLFLIINNASLRLKSSKCHTWTHFFLSSDVSLGPEFIRRPEYVCNITKGNCLLLFFLTPLNLWVSKATEKWSAESTFKTYSSLCFMQDVFFFFSLC